VWTSVSQPPGPSLIKQRICWAAVSKRLRATCLLRYTHVGNVNQNVKVAVLSLIVKVTETTVHTGNDI
jgi:hypothetical protein